MLFDAYIYKAWSLASLTKNSSQLNH